jgi:hypothetical protein
LSQFLGDRLADACLRVAARTDLVGVGHIDLDALARQVGGQGTPTGRAASAARPAGPLARIHLDRVGHGGGLVGQLGKGEPQLIGADALGLLPEQPLAEDVELMPECRVLPLRARELVAQRGDERLRGGQIDDVGGVRHARIIRERGSPYKGRLRDPLVPPAAPRLRDLHARQQQQ